jgi:hypothetical protein
VGPDAKKFERWISRVRRIFPQKFAIRQRGVITINHQWDSGFLTGSLVGQHQLNYDSANGGERDSSKERMGWPDFAGQAEIPKYDAGNGRNQEGD